MLKAVQSATGASVDSPGFASERVYVKLGPGEPRDILASLLNGSRYDYIMIGSQQQPNSVARVMLTMRSDLHGKADYCRSGSTNSSSDPGAEGKRNTTPPNDDTSGPRSLPPLQNQASPFPGSRRRRI